jgi:hypothetical protein
MPNDKKNIFAFLSEISEKSYWRYIKELAKDYIKAETHKEGIPNLIFGIMLFFLAVFICAPSTLVLFMAAIFNSGVILVPWYGILSIFVIIALYFFGCGIFVIKNHK